MKFLKKNQSKLLPRIEIEAEVAHTGKSTPSNASLQEEIAKGLKTEKDLVVTKHIYSQFGEGKSKIIAYVYKDKKSLEKIEKLSKKEKTKIAEVDKPKKRPKAINVKLATEESKENGKETDQKQENK